MRNAVDLSPGSVGPGAAEGALDPYLKALRARWPLVVAVTLSAFLGSLAWLAIRTPDYKATANLLVTPIAADDPAFQGIDVLRADPNDSTRTLQTAAAIVDGGDAAALAARRLGSGWTERSVEAAVEVEPQGESNIVSVTALAEGAELSARVANEFTRAVLDSRKQRIQEQVAAQLERLRAESSSGLEPVAASELADRIDRLSSARVSGDPSLSVSDRASAPGAPQGAPPWIVVALALIGGFTLGMGAALVMEVFDRRIRDEEELRRLYSLPVLAQVPALSRRRQRSLSSPASTPPEVREAFRTLQVQLDRTGRPPRVITLTSASAGDAKTTSAVNLAIALVGAGHRVILVDFDLRKPDIGRLLETKPSKRLTSLLSPGVSLEDLLVEAPRVPNLRVLGARDQSDAVLLEPLSRKLPELFQEARELADYVVVDTPPLGEVSDALRLFDLVDDVLVVARPGHTNRANFELMRDLLTRSGRNPTGFLMIGEPPGRVTSYYAHGMASRDAAAERWVPALTTER